MKINWKVRFKNRVFLASLFGLVVSFVFDLLALFDVFPALSESMVMQLVNILLMVLSAVGVINDPTTAGLNDSERAMGYEEPYTGNSNG